MALLLLSALPAGADVALSGRRWRNANEALKLLAPWRKCPEIANELGLETPDDDLPRPHLSARPLANGVEAFLSEEGSGRWAYGVYTRLRLTRGSCEARGSIQEGGKESLDGGMRRVGLGGATPPSLPELAVWDEAVLVGDPDRPELAAARLLVQLAREDDAEPAGVEAVQGVLGPAWPVQPSHPGRPKGAPAAIWSPAALAAAGVADPWLKNDNDDSFDAIEHGAVRAPRLLRRTGRWEIWEMRFRTRLGGGLLAVYDVRGDRHRWLWATSYDHGVPEERPFYPLDNGHFDLLALRGDLLVVRNLFDGRAYLWAIDLARGVARQVSGDGHMSVRTTADGVVIQPEEGAERAISWSALRP